MTHFPSKTTPTSAIANPGQPLAYGWNENTMSRFEVTVNNRGYPCSIYSPNSKLHSTCTGTDPRPHLVSMCRATTSLRAKTKTIANTHGGRDGGCGQHNELCARYISESECQKKSLTGFALAHSSWLHTHLYRVGVTIVLEQKCPYVALQSQSSDHQSHHTPNYSHRIYLFMCPRFCQTDGCVSLYHELFRKKTDSLIQHRFPNQNRRTLVCLARVIVVGNDQRSRPFPRPPNTIKTFRRHVLSAPNFSTLQHQQALKNHHRGLQFQVDSVFPTRGYTVTSPAGPAEPPMDIAPKIYRILPGLVASPATVY